MTGHLHGGWGFIWAAYTMTATVLVVYTVSVFLRLSAAKKKDRPNG